MISWYPCFLLSLAALWAFSSPRDTVALRIILLATLGSTAVVHLVTQHIPGAWKLVVPATVETITILCLFHWSRNRTGYLQIGCLIIAWLAHLICYVDIVCGTDVVYSHYEAILLAVAVAQLAAFYDTVGYNYRRLRSTLRCSGVGALQPSSLRSSVLRHQGRS